ncbi:MAG: PhoH family protein [Planctomycetota bacterium]
MEQHFEVPDSIDATEFFGIRDSHLKRLREHFQVEISARGRSVTVKGDEDPTAAVVSLFEKMVERVGQGGSAGKVIDDAVVEATPAQAAAASGERRIDVSKLARTPGQRHYIRGIATNDITVCIGPAGTGKTYLAVRMAVEALKSGEAKKLILCRPAVEAGENLGFLPGDFHAKVNPYLRPLYDALHTILEYDQIRRYTDREIIEIVPLAYMRGRTLSSAFIILDEGQNTTPAQMKMFLTRMGEDSKIVVTGDTTQVDLPHGQLSGLIHAERVLGRVEGICWQRLTAADIVRHPLVAKIVDAYEDFEGSKRGSGSGADKLRKGKSR